MPATLQSANINHTISVGIITIISYINPIMYTPESLAAKIYIVGTGIDNSKSLSLALYRLAYVLNTLPNTPREIAISPINAKYSHPRFTLIKGAHIVLAS